MRDEAVRDAYRARSAEYIDKLGRIEDTAAPDRHHVLEWARGVDGLILDVGCGPGQWTYFLHGHGLTVEGIDPVPEFVDHARRRYPEVSYRVGDAGQLDVQDGAVGGVLAWYSLIHADPDELGRILAEFARCLRPGGHLAIGFFAGRDLSPFDHAVTRAYFWPPSQLAERIEEAGFAVTDCRTRSDPGARRHGAICAHSQR